MFYCVVRTDADTMYISAYDLKVIRQKVLIVSPSSPSLSSLLCSVLFCSVLNQSYPQFLFVSRLASWTNESTAALVSFWGSAADHAQVS